jgi:hypothetical protein
MPESEQSLAMAQMGAVERSTARCLVSPQPALSALLDLLVLGPSTLQLLSQAPHPDFEMGSAELRLHQMAD